MLRDSLGFQTTIETFQMRYCSPFMGVGSWFVNAKGLQMGPTYTTFLFQLSFATTATTIVSGAIAERWVGINGTPKPRYGSIRGGIIWWQGMAAAMTIFEVQLCSE